KQSPVSFRRIFENCEKKRNFLADNQTSRLMMLGELARRIARQRARFQSDIKEIHEKVKIGGEPETVGEPPERAGLRVTGPLQPESWRSVVTQKGGFEC
ncbi:hypothetical protein K0M31_017612, partial [Melipona bicolor]